MTWYHFSLFSSLSDKWWVTRCWLDSDLMLTWLKLDAELINEKAKFEKSDTLSPSIWTHDCQSSIGDQDIHIDCQDNYKLISSDPPVLMVDNINNCSNSPKTCLIQCPDEVMLSKESRIWKIIDCMSSLQLTFLNNDINNYCGTKKQNWKCVHLWIANQIHKLCNLDPWIWNPLKAVVNVNDDTEKFYERMA